MRVTGSPRPERPRRAQAKEFPPPKPRATGASPIAAARQLVASRLRSDSAPLSSAPLSSDGQRAAGEIGEPDARAANWTLDRDALNGLGTVATHRMSLTTGHRRERANDVEDRPDCVVVAEKAKRTGQSRLRKRFQLCLRRSSGVTERPGGAEEPAMPGVRFRHRYSFSQGIVERARPVRILSASRSWTVRLVRLLLANEGASRARDERQRFEGLHYASIVRRMDDGAGGVGDEIEKIDWRTFSIQLGEVTEAAAAQAHAGERGTGGRVDILQWRTFRPNAAWRRRLAVNRRADGNRSGAKSDLARHRGDLASSTATSSRQGTTHSSVISAFVRLAISANPAKARRP